MTRPMIFVLLIILALVAVVAGRSDVAVALGIGALVWLVLVQFGAITHTL